MGSQLKDAYNNWISNTFNNREALAFTLNFRHRINSPRKELLTYETAASTVRRFYRGLCRKVYGCRPASKPGGDARLLFATVKEGVPYRQDHAGTQLHYHGVIEVPSGMHTDSWANICEQAWTDLLWADKSENMFTPYRTSGFVSYMLKNRTKEDWEAAIDLDTLWLGPADKQPPHSGKLPFSIN